MRVLFTTYSTAFQNPGGGENVMMRLQAALTARGHEVECFEPLRHRPSDFDLCHHFSLVDCDQWEYWKRASGGKPLFVTPVAHFSDRPLGALRWRARLAARALEEIALGRRGYPFGLPELWLAATEKEAGQLTSHYGVAAGRVRVLPNGVEPAYREGDPEAFRRATGITVPFVLHVGRFHPVKNQLTLLRAAASAGISVVCIGGADVASREYRQRCVDEAARLEARVPGARFAVLDAQPFGSPLLRSAYKAAAAFALPSEFETFGIAALEALIAGLPLVLTSRVADRAPFPGAHFVDPDDAAAIAAALRKAVAGEGRPSAETIRRTEAAYSWETIADRLAGYYAEATERRA